MAFEALFQVYCTDLHQFLSRKIQGENARVYSANDILQNTRMQAMRDIRQFRGKTEGEFCTWIRRIAMNRLRDLARSLNTVKRGGKATHEQWLRAGEEVADDVRHPGKPQDTPSRAAARNEAAAAVRGAIDQLPESERVAVTLHYLYGFENKEVAKAMNRTSDAVRALLQRGRNHLRELLGSSSAWLSRPK